MVLQLWSSFHAVLMNKWNVEDGDRKVTERKVSSIIFFLKILFRTSSWCLRNRTIFLLKLTPWHDYKMPNLRAFKGKQNKRWVPLFRAELYLELCSLWALVLEDFGEHLNEPSPLFRCLLLSSLCHFHLLVPHEGQPLRAVSMAVCRSLPHHSIFRLPPLPAPRQYPSCICQTLSFGLLLQNRAKSSGEGKKKKNNNDEIRVFM